MERPAKRLRIGSFLHDDDDADDELFLDPNEVNAQRDPAVLLEQSRAVASFKLKSRWEDVFARFEKDFTGEDDIINFYTDDLPEVEVDNGHLRSLADADDAKSVAESESADFDEEERILQGKGAGDGQLIRAGPSSLMSRPAYPGRLSGLGSLATGPARLSTMFSTGAQFPSFSSFSLFKSSAKPLDSRWNAPELPPEAFDNHANARTVTRRRVAVKALPAPEHDDSDEDDILMGNATPQSENKLKETEQPVLPTVAVQESGPAADDTLPRVVTRAPSYATESALGLQKRLEARSEGGKSGPSKAVHREPNPVVGNEHAQETHFDTSHITQAMSNAPSPGKPKRYHRRRPAYDKKEVRSQEKSRKHARPKTNVEESGPAVTDTALEQAAPEIPQIAGSSHEAQEAKALTERKKPGRRRKQPKADVLVREPTAEGRSEVMVVPDSDAELLHSSFVVTSDLEGPHESSDDTSSAEPSSRPAKPLRRLEVQLFRRRRPDTMQVRSCPEPRLLGGAVPEDSNEQLDGPSTTAGKHASVRKNGRTLSPPSVSTVREDQQDGRKSESLPPSQRKAVTLTKSGIVARHPCEHVVVMESQDARACEVLPGQSRPLEESAIKTAAPAQQFSRNFVDEAYCFSDEDEAFVPLSRAKRNPKHTKRSTSTSRRTSAKRVATGSAPLGSSPSIRVAFPAVRKTIRTSSAKTSEETLAQRPEPTETTADEPSSAPVLSNPQVEDFVATAAEHTGPSSSSKVDGLTFSAQPDPALDKSQAKEVPSTPFSKRLKDMSAPAAAVLVTPSSRHNKSNSTGNHPSTSKRSILSLLSDSDEDELSLSLDQISPVVKSVSKQHHVLPIRSRSTMKKQSFKRTSLGSYNRATPTQKKSKLSGGWNSASAARVARRVSGVDNGEVHRTPGGTMRRCGEDGFKCERDFCFACL